MNLVLGIFPPNIAEILLPTVIGGIVGFLLCYAHRFLGFAVIPLFLFWCVYQINYLEFFTALMSTYMLIVYSTMLLSFVSILVGTLLSWKRYRSLSKLI
jgi:hypothetical protein